MLIGSFSGKEFSIWNLLDKENIIKNENVNFSIGGAKI
jgi:hypothetical protein